MPPLTATLWLPGSGPADPAQRRGQGHAVLLTAEVFRQGDVQIESSTRPFSFFLFIPAEIRVGEAGVAVQGYGEHVRAVEEDVLGAVAMMVVDVQHRHPPVPAQALSRRGRGVEIAEPSENPPFRVVPWRARLLSLEQSRDGNQANVVHSGVVFTGVEQEVSDFQSLGRGNLLQVSDVPGVGTAGGLDFHCIQHPAGLDPLVQPLAKSSARSKACSMLWEQSLGCPDAVEFEGHLGAHVRRPTNEESDGEYSITIRYHTEPHLLAWAESEVRAAHLRRNEHMLLDGDNIEIHSGIDYWFTPKGTSTKVAKPWKQFLITLSAIFPLTIVVPWLFESGMKDIPTFISFIGTKLLVATTIVWPVVYVIMPRYTRLVAKWLYK